MTFRDILAKFRNISFSERDKGDRFERLMQAFLQTVPWYEGKFQHVWLWKEFPYKNNLGGKDTGIDLVAQTVEGDFWAIQCKCFDEKARIDKPAVDSFLTTSSKQFVNDQLQTTSFALRLWISTTNKWGSEAENAIRHQETPVQRISLADLESAPVDWSALEKGISGAQARQEELWQTCTSTMRHSLHVEKWLSKELNTTISMWRRCASLTRKINLSSSSPPGSS